MATLYFVINQNLLDGSAHTLYCFRHCWWLAQTRPESRVELVFAGRSSPREAHDFFHLPALPNLAVTGLLAIRKPRNGRGITLNAMFHWAAYWHLRRHARAGDWLITASFPKLFSFLHKRDALRNTLKFAYEVHQLALLDHGKLTAKAQDELDLLRRADTLFTTTRALADTLRAHNLKQPLFNVGLACGFDPVQFPSRPPHPELFSLGYIGSFYREQGVEWLVREWPRILQKLPLLRLEIAGGTPAEVAGMKAQAGGIASPDSVHFHGAIPPSRIGEFISSVDALVIPALPEGRAPFVAFTKAYDYLGLNRPVIAADIPSITEVMRPGLEAASFAAGNSQSLTDALQKIYRSPETARSLVAAAALRARELNWESRSRRFWTALDSGFSAGPKSA